MKTGYSRRSAVACIAINLNMKSEDSLRKTVLREMELRTDAEFRGLPPPVIRERRGLRMVTISRVTSREHVFSVPDSESDADAETKAMQMAADLDWNSLSSGNPDMTVEDVRFEGP